MEWKSIDSTLGDFFYLGLGDGSLKGFLIFERSIEFTFALKRFGTSMVVFRWCNGEEPETLAGPAEDIEELVRRDILEWDDSFAVQKTEALAKLSSYRRAA